MSSRFNLNFIKKEKIAKDMYSFYFDKSKSTLNFAAGEYIRMTLDIKKPDSRGSFRYFTIASSPLNKDFLIITTRVIKSSFKKRLLNLKNGESVSFFGPMGNFVFNYKNKKQNIFLSGGMGITTFYSMILNLSQIKSNANIILLSSFSNKDEFIYKNEFEKISKQHPNIQINYFNKRFSSILIGDYIKNLKNSEIYVAGPPKMVENTKNILISLGVSGENINLEDFTGY